MMQADVGGEANSALFNRVAVQTRLLDVW
jgi:hypothetical protein